MTRAQLSEAMALARSDADLQDDISIFAGCGLRGFQPVVCTLDALARLIRWQCFCLDGSIDQDELNEIARIGRQKFYVLDGSEGGGR